MPTLAFANPVPLPPRAALLAALEEDRHHDAADLAEALARAGAWDRVVAATLVLCGDPGSPFRARAELELGTAEAAARIADDPSSIDDWHVLLEGLVRLGRGPEALAGLRRAAAEGRIGVGPWHLLALALIDGGNLSGALAVTRGALEHHPVDPDLWALSAVLAAELGDAAAARRAIARAEAANPLHAAAWVARIRLALHEEDAAALARAREVARTLGAPSPLLDFAAGASYL